MFQRLQSLFLILAAGAVLLLVIAGPATLWVQDGQIALFAIGSTSWSNPMFLAYLLVSAAVIVTLLITLGLYSQRKRQMVYCNLAMGLITLLYAIIIGSVLNVIRTHSGMLVWSGSWGLALPAIMLILVWMAKNRIRKDEELVRSIDRIR